MSASDWKSASRWRAGGAMLEVQCVGPPPAAAPTLVLLHEGLGCAALWRDIPGALAAATGFGVLSYSRAGYGRSDRCALPRPIDYMTREATGALTDILHQLNPGACVLVGHSDGASIAALHAGLVGDARVRGLVLMAPHFFAEAMGLRAIEAARTAFETGDLRARLAKYHTDPDCAFRGWNDAWLNPAFHDWDIQDALGGITVPTLAIQGAQDEYGTLAQLDALEARSGGPVERLVLDPCRHTPFLDQRAPVLRAVTAFSKRMLSDAAAAE